LSAAFFLGTLETNKTSIIPAVLPLTAASHSSYPGLAGIVEEVPALPRGMVPGYRNLEGKFVMRYSFFPEICNFVFYNKVWGSTIDQIQIIIYVNLK